VTITVPAATLLGQSEAPGEAVGFGLLDAQAARDLVTAAARHPNTRWCVTALHPDGTAAAHGCARGRHPPPPGTTSPTPTGGTSPGPDPPPSRAGHGSRTDQGPPVDQVGDVLLALAARLAPIARGTCDHSRAETSYKPSRKLQHLVNTRNARCSAPGCGRPAARCDQDHTTAWHTGGLTCQCKCATSTERSLM